MREAKSVPRTLDSSARSLTLGTEAFGSDLSGVTSPAVAQPRLAHLPRIQCGTHLFQQFLARVRLRDEAA
jgi:hypothetical protein